MSIRAAAARSLDVLIGSKDAEGVEVGFVEASMVLASGTSVEWVPRFEVKGHPKPAEVASRLFSMGETITQMKI